MLQEMEKERKKVRKKERHLRQWKKMKMRVASCGIRTYDTLKTDALPTELPKQPSWKGLNQTSHMPVTV